MQNISKFILEKLKVTPRIHNLPTWEEFVDALQHCPDKMVYLRSFCEEFNKAKIKDLPKFVNGGNSRYPKSGYISELLADYDTSRNQTVIIYFKYENYPTNFSTIRMWAEDHEILIKSLGEELYTEIYNKMIELSKD